MGFSICYIIVIHIDAKAVKNYIVADNQQFKKLTKLKYRGVSLQFDAGVSTCYRLQIMDVC